MRYPSELFASSETQYSLQKGTLIPYSLVKGTQIYKDKLHEKYCFFTNNNGVRVENTALDQLMAAVNYNASQFIGLPTLYRDFAGTSALNTGVGPTIDFSRASTATYIGSNGLVQTAANNTPRFEYDPVTHEPLGLLIEEARTNLLPYSQQFDNAAWLKTSDVSITANVTTAPDGTTTADKFSGSGYIVQATSSTVNVLCTFSVYAKSGNTNVISIAFGGGGNNQNAFFDLSNGTIISTTPGFYPSITPVGNGWYRCVLTGTATANNVNPLISTYYVGDFYIWGAQFEAGAFATSYIPTVGAATTRATDVAQIIGSNFASLYNQNEATMFAVAKGSKNGVGGASVLLSTRNNSGQEMYLNNIAPRVELTLSNVRVLGVVNYTGSEARVSGAFRAGDYNIAANGTLGTVNTYAGSPAAATMFYMGCGESGLYALNGHLRKLAYYDYRLTDAQLLSLTS